MLSRLKTKYQRAHEAYKKYERLLMPATLGFGFVMDYVTFTHIQVSTALTVAGTYLVITGLAIAFVQLYDAGRVTHKLKFVHLYAPLLIQFLLGALVGNAFIFYWFSASFSASWIFMLIFVGLMVSNELYKEHFKLLLVQLPLYFFVMFSLFSIALPYIFNSLSSRLFLLAGITSFVICVLFVRLLGRASREVRVRQKTLTHAFAAILVALVSFYFANIIPPVPLALREAGVYHAVARANDGYTLTGEHESLLQKMLPGQTVHWQRGKRLYVYTAIFAPTDLRTGIYHVWQEYDETQNAWITKDRLSFTITGGRQQGYRGYSMKSGLEPGKWRVSVETGRGQAMGRLSFLIEEASEAPVLESISR